MTVNVLKSLRPWGAALAFFVSMSGVAIAQTMAPIPDDDMGGRRVRPHSQYVSSSDLVLLQQAFDAADRKQWSVALSIASRISNPAARDVVLWRAYTAKENGAPFSDIDRFIPTHRDWPNQRALQARAEEAMPADAMQPDQVISWFQGRDPVSGEGMIKLGDAYQRKGQDASAKNWLRKGWVEGNFTPDRVSFIAARYSAQLSSEDNQKRAARLVWAGEYGPANAMANWISADYQALIQARIKLRQLARDADAAYARVSGDLRNDPGLLFDRARWLRKRGREAEARPLLIQASANLSEQPPSVDDWWAERHYQTREALDAGNVQQAYQIAAGHDMRKDAGVPYAEAEFLAGWIALQFLNKPDQAYDHFLRLREGVTAPISVARANYWAGRAADKAGRASDAKRNYEAAAQYPMTYYGQLAAAAVNPRANLSLPAMRAASPSTKQAFMDKSLVQAMQSLADVGAAGTLRTFALQAADTFDDRDQYVLLVTFLRTLNEPALALRVAKRGLQKNIPVYDIAYPTLTLPVYVGNGTAPESALVLGLTRQESEFDPEAMSSANARGLMQMIHSTAQYTARKHGIAYSNKNELFTPSKNLQLGMAHISDLLNDFGGSYVLSIASYNAGPGRINQWISTYGDPRNSTADVIDWVERIPFSETRNYVQRVLENAQIYRNIIAGRDTQLAINTDLKRGVYTAMASAPAQFSSTAAAAATTTPTPAATTTATAPSAADAQFASAPVTPTPLVISSTPVPDDEDEVAPAKKPKKGVVSKKKRKGNTVVASNSSKRCKSGTTSKNCRKGS